MKNKRILKILIFVIATIVLGIENSYAAVEIKESTSKAITYKTISECYDMTEEMKTIGQGLEGANVNIKMANNYEWAAVSYFSNSNYGTSGTGGNTGIQLAGNTHYSTNGNITGVMDWGKTFTFTAGIIKSYASKTLTTAGGQSIINNAGTDKIDKFELELDGPPRNYSIAATGWHDSWNSIGTDGNNPYSFRGGLFGFYGGNSISSGYLMRASGAAFENVTFRPVFYAQ